MEQNNKIKLSAVQKFGFDLWEDYTLTELLCGGSAGGSKTWLMCMLCLMSCRICPGLSNYVFRRTAVSLKDSTMKTLLTEVHPAFGVIQNRDFQIKDMGSRIVYSNGSTITFMALDFKPGDPDFAKLGSLLVDNAFIDEAGELPMVQIKDAISSRVGRGKYSQKNKLPGKLILSANPSQNFLRKEYYDPYEALGGGRFQKWENGYTYINDEKKQAYKGFFRFGVADNPFLSKAYIERLRALPVKERMRLLDGNWDYNDSSDSLFTGECFRKSLTHEKPEQTYQEIENRAITHNGRPITEKVPVFKKVIGVDVADSGKDKTVVSLIDDDTLVDIRPLEINRDADKPIARLYAEALIAYAQRFGFTPNQARNIGIEENGVGQALCAMMETLGWRITRCTATGRSRSENYYQLYLDLDSCQLRLYDGLDNYELLKTQMLAHTVTFDSGEPKVGPKDKVRQKIGMSPDYSDSLSWANYMRKTAPSLNRRARIRIVNRN